MASSRTVVARGTAGGEPADRVGGDRAAPRNEVVLVGRVAGSPEARQLPSGDCLVTWRLVVERGKGRRPPEGVRPTTVDTLDCVAWTASLRRAASALQADDVVEVHGALRRRFWRAGAATSSRYEVEATSVRRVARRPAPPGRPGAEPTTPQVRRRGGRAGPDPSPASA